MDKQELKLAAKASAASISPLDYFRFYLEDRQDYRKDPNKWNRSDFLRRLGEHYKKEVTPDNAAIAGKHNYLVNTLLPKLMEEEDGHWSFLTPEILAQCKLPPAARNTKEVWAGNKALARMMEMQFD